MMMPGISDDSPETYDIPCINAGADREDKKNQGGNHRITNTSLYVKFRPLIPVSFTKTPVRVLISS